MLRDALVTTGVHKRNAQLEVAPAIAAPPQFLEVEPELLALLPGFIAHRKSDALAITAALGAGDLRLIGVLAHNMKGTGACYGLPAVTDFGRSLGEAVERRDVAAIGRSVGELSDYLRTVEVATRQEPKGAR